MPEGITVLAQHTSVPNNYAPLILAALIFGAAFIITEVCFLRDVITIKRERTVGKFIAIFILFILIIGITIGLIVMFRSSETVYKVILDDNYPVNEFYKLFTIRNVEGMIYTVVPK